MELTGTKWATARPRVSPSTLINVGAPYSAHSETACSRYLFLMARACTAHFYAFPACHTSAHRAVDTLPTWSLRPSCAARGCSRALVILDEILGTCASSIDQARVLVLGSSNGKAAAYTRKCLPLKLDKGLFDSMGYRSYAVGVHASQHIEQEVSHDVAVWSRRTSSSSDVPCSPLSQPIRCRSLPG